MSMSKKDFIALANTLKAIEPINLKQKNARATNEHRQWLNTVTELASFCQAQNPRFMEDRWIGYILGQNGPNGEAVSK